MLGRFLTADEHRELLRQGRLRADPWLEFDSGALRDGYNRRPFLLRHRLAEHPMFGRDALFALCRRMAPRQIQFRVGAIPGDADFDTSYARFRHGLTMADTLERFEELQAYLCIYNPELDPEMSPVIERLLGEIAAAIEPYDDRVTWFSTYVFISTQDSVTPYHMDREMNFLLQVRGRKTAYLWDPADDEVMSAAERDLLLAHVGTRPPYRGAIEAKAMRFELEPGLGVHHPFIAPHRVHTLSGLSISLAFTFRTAGSDRRTDAHCFNAGLRRLGLPPGPVGVHPAVDRSKAAVMRSVRTAGRLLRRSTPDVAVGT